MIVVLVVLAPAISLVFAAHPGAPIFAPPLNGALEALQSATTRKNLCTASNCNAPVSDYESLPSLRGPNDEIIAVASKRTSSFEDQMYSFNVVLKQLWQNRQTWIATFIASSFVVLCGVIPAFLLPVEAGDFIRSKEGLKKLKRLLSFGFGSIIGDVFLHLLPECWSSCRGEAMYVGLWTVAGLLLCFIVEKCGSQSEDSQHKIAAIMNLCANLVDNFTHGLAIGASFLVNVRFGCLTTFAILVHEVPHEISDFAVLLRADYNRFDAIKAQLFTATGGIIGAAVALSTSSSVLSQSAFWILPFTAGGFLNIALVQVLPDILLEHNPRECLLQIGLIILGIASMGAINLWPH